MSTILTLGAVHHHLIEERLRMRVALILETGEARYMEKLLITMHFDTAIDNFLY